MYFSPSVSTTVGGPLRPGSLGTRTVGYSIPGIGNTGTEFGLRESSAQVIDDLKKKLKMVNILITLVTDSIIIIIIIIIIQLFF